MCTHILIQLVNRQCKFITFHSFVSLQISFLILVHSHYFRYLCIALKFSRKDRVFAIKILKLGNNISEPQNYQKGLGLGP